MMTRIVLYVIAAALIAAHFLRAGSWIPAVLCLMAPLLFLLSHRWSLLLLQWLAYAAAVSWLWTAWELVVLRSATGRPWLLAIAILVTVAAFSALVGALLHSGTMQERYRR
ncbi:MAG: hypothetical protein NTY41_06480 [Proteobacteria bacterium]|nr:hypothetical protein [Pseudomonadota bacterium]